MQRLQHLAVLLFNRVMVDQILCLQRSAVLSHLAPVPLGGLRMHYWYRVTRFDPDFIDLVGCCNNNHNWFPLLLQSLGFFDQSGCSTRRSQYIKHKVLERITKNTPELPSSYFLIDTHRRQPGVFVGSSYSSSPSFSISAEPPSVCVLLALYPLMPASRNFLCSTGLSWLIRFRKHAKQNLPSLVTDCLPRQSTQTPSALASGNPDEQSDEPKCSLVSSVIVAFRSRTGLSCALAILRGPVDLATSPDSKRSGYEPVPIRGTVVWSGY